MSVFLFCQAISWTHGSLKSNFKEFCILLIICTHPLFWSFYPAKYQLGMLGDSGWGKVYGVTVLGCRNPWFLRCWNTCALAGVSSRNLYRVVSEGLGFVPSLPALAEWSSHGVKQLRPTSYQLITSKPCKWSNYSTRFFTILGKTHFLLIPRTVTIPGITETAAWMDLCQEQGQVELVTTGT